MKRNIENENWQAVYSDIPDCVQFAAYSALRRIQLRKKRRRKFAAIGAAAACLAVTAAVLFAKLDVPDRTAVTAKPVIVLTAESVVFASEDDPLFHIDRSCSDHSVELPLITALEFDKTLCPVCGARAVIEK